MQVDLRNLQSSVYRSSGLPHGNILLFQFKQGDAGRARNFLNDIASLVTTADSLVTRADMTNLEKVLNVGITYAMTKKQASNCCSVSPERSSRRNS